MGVRLLSTYCKAVGALDEIKLRDEILKWRVENIGNPNVVFDGINFIISILMAYDMDYIDGRLLDFGEHLTELIKKIKELGCTITVFLDGSNWMYNVDKWIRRRKQKITAINKAFDLINNDWPKERIKECVNPIIPNVWNVFTHILIKEDCEVKYSIQDCDAEILAYAHEKNSMAIFANDSDFIINAPCCVYLTRTMNVESLSFMKINKMKLLASLDLDGVHLPLLATLLGNDIIPAEKMLFYTLFQEKGFFSVISKVQFVSLYIKTLRIGEVIPDNTCRRISWDAFGDYNNMDLIRKSIESYKSIVAVNINDLLSEDKNWNNIIKEVHFKNTNFQTSRIYGVIVQNTYQGSERFEDLRENDIPPVYLITKKLRQKIYGILLFEKPGDPQPIIEMVVTSCTEFKPNLVDAIFPSVHHPGLIALWGKEDHELAKWKLLGDVFSVHYKKIKELPKRLIVPALSMKYLLEEVKFEEWEISAVLLSCVLVNYLKRSELSEIVVHKVQSRAVRVFSVVHNTFGDVIFLLDSLHGPISTDEYAALNYIYGALYHIVYKALRFGLTPSFIIQKGFCLKDYVECEKVFEHIIDFVYKAK